MLGPSLAVALGLPLSIELAQDPDPRAFEAAPAVEAPSGVATARAVAPAPAPAPILRGGPDPRDSYPYFKAEEVQELRERHGLSSQLAAGDGESSTSIDAVGQPHWHCLIADPRCGFTLEVDATSAYAMRFQQSGVRDVELKRWDSARVQYDAWLQFPAATEVEGPHRFTRFAFGPRGGVIASDGGDLWSHYGVAGRLWTSRQRLALSIEFGASLTMRHFVADADGAGLHSVRAPLGMAADFGVGVGGIGAIVIGGQYDSPLAREEVPESLRQLSGGMVFVGFRGNIAWGGPAAAAVATHGVALRKVRR